MASKKKVFVVYAEITIPFRFIKTTQNAYLYQSCNVCKNPTVSSRKKIRITVEEIK